MKNAIKYYYNLVPSDIHHKDDIYYFDTNHNHYLLFPFSGNTTYLNNIYNYLVNNRIMCLNIIPNKDNQMITMINNIPYILLISSITNRKINIGDIINYTIIINSKHNNDWKSKWCEKLDYYEYQMQQFEKKYPIISESFTYYDGMTETAISLLNNINPSVVNNYISHSRIGKNTSLQDLYNPLNMIVDTRVRDVSEYYKNLFFYEKNPLIEINQYLHNNHLTYEECMLFLARMIYPSYYFDIYDDIISGKVSEQKINIITSKVNEYEMFLKEIYSSINAMYNIPEIEWLKKT